MMTVIKKINNGMTDIALRGVSASLEMRKIVFVVLTLLSFIATGAYVAFMVGTTVVAAERRDGLAHIVELVAEVAEKEAVYVSFLDNVNRDTATLLGFVPVDPSYVVRSSFGPGFTLSN